jgi:hypothetical protein
VSICKVPCAERAKARTDFAVRAGGGIGIDIEHALDAAGDIEQAGQRRERQLIDSGLGARRLPPATLQTGAGALRDQQAATGSSRFAPDPAGRLRSRQSPSVLRSKSAREGPLQRPPA